MNLHISASAHAEIVEILDRIRAESPSRAAAVSSGFDEIFLGIADFPGAGRRTKRSTLRCVNTHPYPYLIFYSVGRSLVEIVAVRHGARNPRSMPARPR